MEEVGSREIKDWNLILPGNKGDEVIIDSKTVLELSNRYKNHLDREWHAYAICQGVKLKILRIIKHCVDFNNNYDVVYVWEDQKNGGWSKNKTITEFDNFDSFDAVYEDFSRTWKPLYYVDNK